MGFRFFVFILIMTNGLALLRAEETTPPPLERPELESLEKPEAEKTEEKGKALLVDIYRLTAKQRQLAAKKASQLERREELEADVADLQKDIQEVSQQIKILRKKIILRMRNLHRVSAPTIFQSLFGAHDLMEMDRNARIMYKIAKSDVEQLRTFRGLKNLLNEQQEKLESKLTEFEKTQKNLERQELAIKRIYNEQVDLLKKLGNEDQTIVQKLKDLRKENIHKDRTTLVAGVFEGGIYRKKGSLEFPVQGVISRRFGLLQLTSPKIRVYNKGWFISTLPDKEIQTVHKGQVAFAGFLPDYNKIVIIDHGDHFYSVYANLSQIFVNQGEEVSAQGVVGQAGHSRLYGSGLHFEMRHFSQSEDPAEWFKNSKFHISSTKEQNL